MYADAGKILDEISALAPDALDNIEEVSKDEVADQLERLKKGKGADDKGS